MGPRNTYKEALNNWINDKKADMVFDKVFLSEDCDGKVHLNVVRENTVTNNGRYYNEIKKWLPDE